MVPAYENYTVVRTKTGWAIYEKAGNKIGRMIARAANQREVRRIIEYDKARLEEFPI